MLLARLFKSSLVPRETLLKNNPRKKMVMVTFFLLLVSIVIGVIQPILSRRGEKSGSGDKKEKTDDPMKKDDTEKKINHLEYLHFRMALLRRQVKCINKKFISLTENELGTLVQDLQKLGVNEDGIQQSVQRINKKLAENCYYLLVAYYRHYIMLPMLENQNEFYDKIEFQSHKSKNMSRLSSDYIEYLSTRYGHELQGIKTRIAELYGEDTLNRTPSEKTVLIDHLIKFEGIQNREYRASHIRDHLRKIWYKFKMMIPKHTNITTDIKHLDLYANQIASEYGDELKPALFTNLVLGNDIIEDEPNTIKTNIKKLLYLWVIMLKSGCFEPEEEFELSQSDTDDAASYSSMDDAASDEYNF